MLTKRSIAAALRSNWRTTGWMFLFATLCGCDAVPAGSSLPGLKVYTNPSDPLILSNKIATGESIEVYGERDDQGIPAKLLAAKYQSPQQDGTANATWLMGS